MVRGGDCYERPPGLESDPQCGLKEGCFFKDDLTRNFLTNYRLKGSFPL
jgi:hypothetical protein